VAQFEADVYTEGLGFDPSPDTPARLAQRIKRDEAVFAKVVRDANTKPD